MRNKSIIGVVELFGIIVSLMFFPGYSDSAPEKVEVKQELKFFSGSPSAGGAWYVLSVGVTRILEKSIPGLQTSLVPGGAGGGPISVGEGNAQTGFVNLGPFLDAQEGIYPYQKAYDNLRLLGNLYNHVYQIAVLKDSGINKIPDLRGKIVSTGIKGQAAEFSFKKLLKIYNIDITREIKFVFLGFNDSVEALKDKKIDCWAQPNSLPTPATEDLAMSREIKFLSIDDPQLQEFCSTVNGFRPGIVLGNKIPYKGKYDDLKTAFMPLSVMVRADLPEELVYKMTKALAENLKDLAPVSVSMRDFEPKNLARDLSPKAKFHPGAERYYKERGWR